MYIENKRIVEGLLIDVTHKKNMADEAILSIEDEIQNLYLKVVISRLNSLKLFLFLPECLDTNRSVSCNNSDGNLFRCLKIQRP